MNTRLLTKRKSHLIESYEVLNFSFLVQNNRIFGFLNQKTKAIIKENEIIQYKKTWHHLPRSPGWLKTAKSRRTKAWSWRTFVAKLYCCPITPKLARFNWDRAFYNRRKSDLFPYFFLVLFLDSSSAIWACS